MGCHYSLSNTSVVEELNEIHLKFLGTSEIERFRANLKDLQFDIYTQLQSKIAASLHLVGMFIILMSPYHRISKYYYFFVMHKNTA